MVNFTTPILLAVIFLFNANAILGGPCCSKPATKASSPPARLMGIEIETSAIKTNTWHGKFLVLKDGVPFWEIKGDTTDISLRSTYPDHKMNVECSTMGGLDFETVNEAARNIQAVMAAIYHSQTIPSRFTREEFRALLGGGYDCDLVPYMGSTAPVALSYAPKASNSIVRPQITFQLPLEEMMYPFERLYRLGHEDIKNFLDDLGISPPPLTTAATAESEAGQATVVESSDTGRGVASAAPSIAEEAETKLDSTRASEHTGGATSVVSSVRKYHFRKFSRALQQRSHDNATKEAEIRAYLRESIAKEFRAMPEGAGKGLTLLFLYYWFQLFNEKAPMAAEPGLKPYLGIMSRIPLSQLYDSLEEDQKELFKGFITRHGGFASSCHLRSYRNYSNHTIPIGMSVMDWYSSIIDNTRYQSVTLADGRVRHVDLLSPPPDLPPDVYAMGKLDIDDDANGLALIEARGYGKIKYKRSEPEIDQIIEFVENESKLFFGRE